MELLNTSDAKRVRRMNMEEHNEKSTTNYFKFDANCTNRRCIC